MVEQERPRQLMPQHPAQIAGERSIWCLDPEEANASYVGTVELTWNLLAWNHRSLTGSPVSLRQAVGWMIKWVSAPLLGIAGRDSGHVGVFTLTDGKGDYDPQTLLCQPRKSCDGF
jgi:hypothetical protein